MRLLAIPDLPMSQKMKRKQLLLHDKLPIGRNKGVKINDLDEAFVKEFVEYRAFKINPALHALRRSKYKRYVKPESDYR